MKKHLFILPVLALMISCQPKENTSEENNTPSISENDEVCGSVEIDGVKKDIFVMSEDDFNSINTVVQIFSDEEEIDDAKHVTRTEGLLTFSLTNGEKYTLKDKFEAYDSDVQIYKYVRSLDEISYWLCEVSYYEGGSLILLDQDNGEQINVWSRPVFSPDETHFVTNSMDLEAGYMPNGMQLFEVKDGKASLVWKFEVSDWGPETVNWIDNETIAIQKSGIDYESEDYSYKSEYVKMSIQ